MPRRPDPIPALKQRCAREILILVEQWKQVNGSALFHSRQPRLSELRAGHLHRYSLDRLVRFLHALDREVTIVTRCATWPTIFDHSLVDDPPEPYASMRARRAAAKAAVVAARVERLARDRAERERTAPGQIT